MTMTTFFTGALVTLALGLGAMGGRKIAYRSPSPEEAGQSRQSASGPYRDGFYLGKLSASRGDHFQVAAGRWATKAHREAFNAGYGDGYRTLKPDSTEEESALKPAK